MKPHHLRHLNSYYHSLFYFFSSSCLLQPRARRPVHYASHPGSSRVATVAPPCSRRSSRQSSLQLGVVAALVGMPSNHARAAPARPPAVTHSSAPNRSRHPSCLLRAETTPEPGLSRLITICSCPRRRGLLHHCPPSSSSSRS